MNLTADDIQKLKVVELRAELQSRGLDTKGVKAVLVDRLLAALGQQPSGISLGNGSQISTSGDADDVPTSPIKQQQPEITTSPIKSTSPQRSVQQQIPPQIIVNPIKSPVRLASPPVSPTKPPTISPSPVVSSPIKPTISSSPVALSTSNTATPANNSSSPQTTTAAVTSSPTKAVPTSPIKSTSVKQEPKDNNVQSVPSQNDEKEANVTEIKVEGESVVKVEETTPMETEEAEGGKGIKRKVEDEETTNNSNANNNSNNRRRDGKRFRYDEQPKIVPENEPAFDEDSVLLDWYKSDLNLKINSENFLQAEPIVFNDFPFAYAGAKATYGFTKGKLYYEVKWTETCEVKIEFGENEVKHALRAGWSDLHCGLQLGEEKFSYGIDSRGKLYKDNEVEDFEGTFIEGDVIGCYLDLDSDEIEMKFTKNGELIGPVAKFNKSDVEGKSWFPHVLARNVKFEVNFGQTDSPHAVLEGYQFVSKVDEDKIRGPCRPEKKEECDFTMLVGMACSGKTKWTKDCAKENPDKHYNILGTSTAVERSIRDRSIITAPNAPKCFEAFLMKAGKFVEKLVDIAPSRRRNYILDQSNVLPNVQRRKCGGFEGFRRRAVVILPADEEYQNRIKSKEQEQGKSVPKSTILDMKATFRIPEVGELFSEVEFPEVTKDEAAELVKKYNKEGLTAGYGRSPSVRGGNRSGSKWRGNRGGGGPRGRDNWRGRPPMRGSFPRGGRGHFGPPMRGYGPPRGPPMGHRGMPPLMRGMRPSGPPRGQMGGPMRGGPWNSRGGGDGPRPFRPGMSSAGNMNMGRGGNNQQRGPPPQNMGSKWRGAGNMNQGPMPARPPVMQNWGQQVWGANRPGGNNMNPGFGGQQQFPDPWQQQQQVPDHGYGQSWDASGSNVMGANNASNRGGTWQGYGGQTFGAFRR